MTARFLSSGWRLSPRRVEAPRCPVRLQELGLIGCQRWSRHTSRGSRCAIRDSELSAFTSQGQPKALGSASIGRWIWIDTHGLPFFHFGSPVQDHYILPFPSLVTVLEHLPQFSNPGLTVAWTLCPTQAVRTSSGAPPCCSGCSCWLPCSYWSRSPSCPCPPGSRAWPCEPAQASVSSGRCVAQGSLSLQCSSIPFALAALFGTRSHPYSFRFPCIFSTVCYSPRLFASLIPGASLILHKSLCSSKAHPASPSRGPLSLVGQGALGPVAVRSGASGIRWLGWLWWIHR